jgi:sensor histidine kinase YesM
LSTQIEISKNELKALRAQINPHFIFNSLNSIQHFIVENNNDEATRYLNKFAKLFRMILNNSEKSTVTIREEIDMLTIYLDLESMRFQNKFEYEFILDEKIDPDYEEIPTMLLQPYIENAILHGLTPKKDKGKLTIKITSTGTFLICSIEDNGIGRKLSGELKTSQKASENHRSLGMKITQDRLTLLNSINNSELSMSITDLMNNKGEPAGTKVDIYIPIT